jgi:hypothetical protein
VRCTSLSPNHDRGGFREGGVGGGQGGGGDECDTLDTFLSVEIVRVLEKKKGWGGRKGGVAGREGGERGGEAGAGEEEFREYFAKNVGIRRARGEYVLVTNPDILISGELISALAINPTLLNPFSYYRLDRHDLLLPIPQHLSKGFVGGAGAGEEGRGRGGRERVGGGGEERGIWKHENGRGVIMCSDCGWGGEWDVDEVLRWARGSAEVVQVAPINGLFELGAVDVGHYEEALNVNKVNNGLEWAANPHTNP